MKRRDFLSMMGSASVAPLVPMPVAAAPAAAGYNRYMYGLAVFHARTRASLGAGDLVAKLRVSPGIAQAMMGEMQAKGVLAPVLNMTAGTMRAVAPTGQKATRYKRMVHRAADHLLSDDDGKGPMETPPELSDTELSDATS